MSTVSPISATAKQMVPRLCAAHQVQLLRPLHHPQKRLPKRPPHFHAGINGCLVPNLTLTVAETALRASLTKCVTNLLTALQKYAISPPTANKHFVALPNRR